MERGGRTLIVSILVLVSIIPIVLANAKSASSTDKPPCNDSSHSSDETSGVEVVKWRWDHVGLYLTITVFIVLSGLAKVAFHHAHFISSRVPESCLLILVGVVMGAIIYHGLGSAEKNCISPGDFNFPDFTTDLFFFFLLPPIILEAAYSLYDRAFFDNLATILLMAVVGTAFNFLSIGFLLYGVYYVGAMGKIRLFEEHAPLNYTLPGYDHAHLNSTLVVNDYDLSSEKGFLEVLLFSSLISAVDPVAVLAIFQEVGVNPDLYFLVFGESLLNDGVAVVLYNMMTTFNEMKYAGLDIDVPNIVLGLVSFLTISLGGLFIGILHGFATALITKTTTQVRVVEPLALLGMAYQGYVVAELFHWSGIISLIGCGLVQAHYSFKNISKKSYTTVKYFIKMTSATSDGIIFLYLGIALVKGPHTWHTGFVIWTLSFCLICRFLGVYGLTWLANRRRVKRVNLQEQFIMAYGGLRGAVGFSLVEMINMQVVPPKQMFVTTMLATVVFTVFFQGGTIKFLVDLLGIDRKSDVERLISEEVNDTVMEHMMAGIEIISGKRGHQYIGNVVSQFDEKYLMRIFCKQSQENDLTRLYEKLSMADHLCNLYGPTIVQEDKKGSVLLANINAEYFGDEPASDNFRNGFSKPGDQKPLLPIGDDSEAQQSPPPPIPPRSTRALSMIAPGFFGAQFRARAGTDATATMLQVPHDRSRRASREEVEAVRSAFRQNPYARYHQRYNPNLIDDDDQELASHLKLRHARSRKISEIVLQNQDLMFRPGSRISVESQESRVTTTRTKHFSMLSSGELAAAVEDAANLDIDPDLTSQLLNVPSRDRLGVQAVLARHGQRVRSLSVCSDRSGQSDLRHRKVSEAGFSRMEAEGGQAYRTGSPAESLTSIGSATKKTPQRKQTPAPSISSPVPPPVSPSVSSTRQEYFQPSLMKLSPLVEGEETGSKEEIRTPKRDDPDKK